MYIIYKKKLVWNKNKTSFLKILLKVDVGTGSA